MKEETCDIVIVGAGPFGLFLSLCLSRWGYNVKHIDNRVAPTKAGRADGIQTRSIELLRNLGLKSKLMAYKPARVYDVAFWDPLPDGKGIHHTENWPSCPPSIDTRYPFSILLHQGIIEKVFLDEIVKCGTTVHRPCTIVDFGKDGKNYHYPVSVTIKDLNTNVEQSVRTKYLVSAEGSRSSIREKVGIRMQHKDPIAHIWAVMDGVVRTDFPDIRTKCTIHADSGSVMVIPREDNMVRLYTKIASSTDPDWDLKRTVTVQQIQETVKKAFKPYEITWDSVEWYSAYPIGQGLAERYSRDQRIFIGGDAAHTHSPKAGQGMNAAFHDALNLSWKLHLVEGGFADRSILETYETERRLIAQQLLDFDALYAKLFSQRLSITPGSKEASEFSELHKSAADFTSGYGVVYPRNTFNWSQNHLAKSPLFIQGGKGLHIGRAFPPATVTRISDAYHVALEHEIPMNGSFRLWIYAGDPVKSRTALADLCRYLEEPSSFYSLFLTPEHSVDSDFERHNPHSRFFSIGVVFAAERNELSVSMLPPLLRAYRHHVYADDVLHKRSSRAIGFAHEKIGFDSNRAGVVVLRPDGHVACIVRLEKGRGTADALNKFFASFTSKFSQETLMASRL